MGPAHVAVAVRRDAIGYSVVCDSGTSLPCSLYKVISNNKRFQNYIIIITTKICSGQCKSTGGCYNELVVAFYSTGGGVKGKKIYTC